jgi:hypothetical protein
VSLPPFLLSFGGGPRPAPVSIPGMVSNDDRAKNRRLQAGKNGMIFAQCLTG